MWLDGKLCKLKQIDKDNIPNIKCFLSLILTFIYSQTEVLHNINKHRPPDTFLRSLTKFYFYTLKKNPNMIIYCKRYQN